MHSASLVKIHRYLLKLLSGNENPDSSRADYSIKNSRNLPNSNPQPDLHSINAYTNFGEYLFKFTQVIIRKQKYGWMDVRQTAGHTDSQHNTIIPITKKYIKIIGLDKGGYPVNIFLISP